MYHQNIALARARLLGNQFATVSERTRNGWCGKQTFRHLRLDGQGRSCPPWQSTSNCTMARDQRPRDPYLALEEPGRAPRFFPLSKPVIRIGRAGDNDI